ncbi:hypothetical protein NQ314_019359 [Rhamnusium bicolor]|uniref:DDE Tnp4 domain-containing protein n=1 Tax=Rhamnusium bicolor TaxID=1586634 RepID=A0AAV8WNN6_9CUCU|nr:hypothetical protein NQ314_019359 [Rhamnusium bicolor]
MKPKVTGNIFGILCHTFRISFTPINIKTSTVDLIVLACCCLHNMLRNEYILNHRRKTNLEGNLLFPTENMIPLKGIGGFACTEGFQVRRLLCKRRCCKVSGRKNLTSAFVSFIYCIVCTLP